MFVVPHEASLRPRPVDGSRFRKSGSQKALRLRRCVGHPVGALENDKGRVGSLEESEGLARRPADLRRFIDPRKVAAES